MHLTDGRLHEKDHAPNAKILEISGLSHRVESRSTRSVDRVWEDVCSTRYYICRCVRWRDFRATAVWGSERLMLR
jgi:hypothetical protein